MSSITDWLDTACELYPEEVAVADGNEKLSFQELRRRAWGLGNYFASIGFCRQVIGIYAHRRAEVIAAMLGCAVSGNIYLPLDPNAPESKIRKILRDSNAKGIIALEDSDYTGIQECCTCLRLDENVPVSDIRPDFVPSDKDVLYIIYTSGSTGDPKGILKCHGAVKNFIDAYVKELSFTQREIIGNQTPFCFDASAKDIFLMLKTGARLEIIPSEKFVFPVTLIEYLNEKKITFISWVPSALAVVARLRTFRDIIPTTLKRVAFVGEVFPVKDLEAWRAALPDLEYINLYGSSELSGIACLYRIPKGKPCEDPLPIGRPLGNSKVYLWDNNSVSCDRGEILIESGALAEGYLNDPQKTSKVFSNIEIKGRCVRVLHTGDWARYDENGELVFLARGDSQIKYKGYRIELGEIEAAANDLDYIRCSCCLYNADKERITLFCESSRDDIKLRTLNEDLSARLPSYMLPRKLIVLEKLPLNTNGKIDRVYLKTLL